MFHPLLHLQPHACLAGGPPYRATRILPILVLGSLVGCAGTASPPSQRPADVTRADDASQEGRSRRFEAARLIEGEPIYSVVAKDGIPAIDNPTFVSADLAASFMAPGETVLGVVGRDGTARAYSTWVLDRHEIVNDVLDGLPIMATW